MSQLPDPRPDSLESFKNSFVHTEQFTHLNNAGIAPISRPAKDALNTWADRLYQEGIYCIPDLVSAMETCRERLGLLLNAPANGIAFFQGTANAISQAAFGLELNAGEEILLWDQEYPSNFYPWRDAAERANAKLVTVASDENLAAPLEKLFAAVTARTRVIALSWVQFQTGALTDLEALSAFARSRGILTIIDAIQGIGVLPLDFAASGVDIVCGGSHKWMASPIGVGFLCARPEILQQLKPQAVGAMTYGSTEELANLNATLRPGPARLEPGSRPFIEIAALSATLGLFLATGTAAIAQEAELLAKCLVTGLRERGYRLQSPHGAHHRGAIVNFASSPEARHTTLANLETALGKNGIAFAKRHGGIRLSPHAFNTREEIDRTLAVL